jgi:hypothetical protein
MNADETRSLITGEGFDEVRSILGEPAVVTNWDTQAPPRDASTDELTEFRETALDTIWVYAGVVVSFNVAGVAKLVTSDSWKYMGKPHVGVG